jgi:hypothetical protein
MARKIVRDIQQKKHPLLKLEEKDLQHFHLPRKNVLDISGLEETKIVITKDAGQKIQDIASKMPQTARNSEKISFLQVDRERRSVDRAGELMRLVLVGGLILFCLNLVNIFERGTQVKDTLVAAAFGGYNDLLQGGKEATKSNFPEAQNSFSQAAANFQKALQTIDFLNVEKHTFFSKEKTLESAKGLLEAGKSLSLAGANFSKGIEHMRSLPEMFLQENNVSKAAGSTKKSLTQKLEQDLGFLESATKEIEIASDNLALVDESVLPDHLKPKLKLVKEQVDELKKVLRLTQEKIPVLLKMLGDRYLHRYLVLLQNDTEARPTGGFIGSYLLIDVNDGYITKSEFHDVYESDGQLKESIPAPEDIAKITKKWGLRDSNYSPDFSFSAEKAAFFLQKAKGPSVDTVIAVNQSILADLFELTGPIKLEGFDAPFTKDNYQQVISYMVEAKLDGEQDPKKILRSFIPEFQKKFFSSDWPKALNLLLKAARNGDILFYSRDEEIEAFFEELGLGGRVLSTKPNEDYLNVINTSIGGNKSDAYINQKIAQHTFIGADGSVTNELTIARTHTWNEQSLQKLQKNLEGFGFVELPEYLQKILGKGTNKSMVKVYVPLGSILIEAAGIDKKNVMTREDQETKKTFFLFEMDTDPGQETKVSLSYRLPYNLTLNPMASYRFFAQRQPGITVSQFEKKVSISPSLRLESTYPENLQTAKNKDLQITGPLENKVFMAVLLSN